jgi:hypothetical protein
MAGWPVWRVLRERDHVVLEWRDTPRTVSGMWIPSATGATIILASWLGRRARRCTLSHELVHDERGIAYTADAPEGLVAKEEAWVNRTSVLRLVPPVELASLVCTMIDLEEPVTIDLVADHFDVTAEVAELALRFASRS